MEISSNLNVCKPQMSQNVAFGMKKSLPLSDVMSIITGSPVTGTQKSVEETVQKIINRAPRAEVNDRYLDYIDARSILLQRCPELIPAAEKFRNALDNISYNHFAITKEDAAMIVDKAAEKYGSKFVNVEI